MNSGSLNSIEAKLAKDIPESMELDSFLDEAFAVWQIWRFNDPNDPGHVRIIVDIGNANQTTVKNLFLDFILKVNYSTAIANTLKQELDNADENLS